MSEVARRHGLSPQQLFTWRRHMRQPAAIRAAEPQTFVPAVVTPSSTPPERHRDIADGRAKRPRAPRAAASSNLRSTASRSGQPQRGCRNGWGRDPRAEDLRVICPTGAVRVMVATRLVDFRKGAEGLAALVRESMQADPLSGAVYVFRAKRADRVKLIYWDGTGVCLLAKRLETGSFCWPNVQDGVIRLTAAQLSALLEGLDWTGLDWTGSAFMPRASPHRRLRRVELRHSESACMSRSRDPAAQDLRHVA